MNDKFDPAPFDKYAVDPKEAIEVGRIVDQQLQAGIVGGSFPASDPISATPPSSSKYDDKSKSCGEGASRAEAISQAHEAIEDGLRANASSDQDAQLPQVIGDVLHVLHGARGLPSPEAVEALRPFLNTMRSRVSGSDRLADASADAVGALVQRLEVSGIATDDLWEEAIEASLSFANETGFSARSILEG